jgi:hypothetical protein
MAEQVRRLRCLLFPLLHEPPLVARSSVVRWTSCVLRVRTCCGVCGLSWMSLNVAECRYINPQFCSSSKFSNCLFDNFGVATCTIERIVLIATVVKHLSIIPADGESFLETAQGVPLVRELGIYCRAFYFVNLGARF